MSIIYALFKAAAEEPGGGREREDGDDGHWPEVVEDDIGWHGFQENSLGCDQIVS